MFSVFDSIVQLFFFAFLLAPIVLVGIWLSGKLKNERK